jgi:hypothetical protein
MDWHYIQKKPRHWDSIFPDGYFIVVADTDDGGETYALYEGDFNDWVLPTGNPLKKIGAYYTPKAAKAAAEALEAK